MSAYSASVALRASISLGSQPGASKCEAYLPDMSGYRIPETKECCALVIVEPIEKFRGRFIRGIRCGVGDFS